MTNFNQGLLQTLDEVLQQSLRLPLLSYSDLAQFRRQLTLGLQQNSSTLNSVFLGGQSATPGMAFLSGYQNAIRCLDRECPDDLLAAFCVSEKGVKKPWDMLTRLTLVSSDSDSNAKSYQLSGKKGYVMLLPDDLDRLYVITKNEAEQLRCVYLSSKATGVSITEPLKAPFIQDIPHSGVGFSNVSIEETQLMDIDGHQEANKPFRYWEDVHVTLAMMAWMLRGIADAKDHSNTEMLFLHMKQLVVLFEESPEYYSLESFSILDDCQNALEHCSKMLPENLNIQWKTDRALLQMGQKIRQLVKSKMLK